MPAKIDHPSFKQPPNQEIKLWRYMDFTKFVSMLSTSSLYFGKASCFEDKFEGSFPAYNAIKNMQVAIDEEQKQSAFNYNCWLKNLSKDMRDTTFINCWHANEYESAAMWSLYAKTNESIAIETNYSALLSALPDNSYLGMVTYLDYDNEEIPDNNTFYPIMHKRISFEHEKEIRSVIWREDLFGSSNNNLTGLNIKVDINSLIKGIYISPTAPHWFYETVKDVAQKYGLLALIYKSDLYNDPFI